MGDERAGGPIDPLPIGAGQPIALHLAAAGLLWGVRAVADRGEIGGRVRSWSGEGTRWPRWSDAAAGLVAFAGVFAVLAPLSGVLHRMAPSPERLAYGIVVGLGVLPFFAALEALLRRGGPVRRVLAPALGKVLLLVVLIVGLGLGTVPSVVGLVLPLLAIQYVLEVVAAFAFARSANAAAIAVLDGAVVAWMAVTVTPLA